MKKKLITKFAALYCSAMAFFLFGWEILTGNHNWKEAMTDSTLIFAAIFLFLFLCRKFNSMSQHPT